jgi:serine/threonine protein phosphatase PrpC
VLESGGTLEDMTRRMIEAACQAGGPDNIGCVLVRCTA